MCDKCGGELYQRDDDKEATVRNRLEVYSQQTAGLLQYYAGQKKLVRVNGALPREESLKEIFKALDALKR